MSNRKRIMEQANKRMLGEDVTDGYVIPPNGGDTKMFHCDAKSCEHYKEMEGTSNCILKQISVSAKGGCNQYEPKTD